MMYLMMMMMSSRPAKPGCSLDESGRRDYVLFYTPLLDPPSGESRQGVIIINPPAGTTTNLNLGTQRHRSTHPVRDTLGKRREKEGAANRQERSQAEEVGRSLRLGWCV